MTEIIQIIKCEVCGNSELVPVLDLGVHPLCDDLKPVGSRQPCNTYPIHILYCKICDTAHQGYQVPKHDLFPATYHYRARFTADVLSGMDSLVESIETRVGVLKGLTVLDVGCNDGSLLDRFSAKGARTVGIEPTGAYADAEGRGHLIINDYFSELTSEKILELHSRVDIITFTNVFAHIENLPALLKALALLMNEDTLIIIENHYLGAVLDRNQFDTFYHEHPRTYSLNSLLHIAKVLGRDVVDVQFPKRYGGNIRVEIGKIGAGSHEANKRINDTLQHELGFFEQFARIRSFVDTWRSQKKTEIQQLVSTNGKLLAKAFPGRAAILVAMLGLSENEVECVYEKPGSLKIGHYVPGTRIPIRSDKELIPCLAETEVLFNLAWHIPDEIEQYLRSHGFNGRIVHVV